MIQPDGTTRLVTHHYDTVVIKTNAALHDSWLFFRDSSANYYMATVTALDTATISGSIDSVKTITINSYSGVGINNADTLNDITLLLSKKHGLIQCFELGMFPLKSLDNVILGYINFSIVTKSHLYFQYADSLNPTFLELYDFNVGDRYFYSWSNSNSSKKQILQKTIIDKKLIAPDTVQYTYGDWIHDDYGNTSSTYWTSETETIGNRHFINDRYMPEELGSDRRYFYIKGDNALCTPGIYIDEGGGFSSNGEYDGTDFYYKKGLGIIDSIFSIAQIPMTINMQLIGFYKSYPCGNTQPLSIINQRSMQPNIYPNPATNQLTIVTGNTAMKNVILSSITGQLLIQEHTTKSSFTLNTENIQPGIYVLKVTFADNTSHQQKVTIIK